MKKIGLFILVSLGSILTLETQEVASQLTETYQKKLSIAIEYGNSEEKVGFLQATENVEWPPLGPESFFVDNRGNTYIGDTVNQRIQVFSSVGCSILTINLTHNIVLSDLVVHETGNVYVYDDVHGQLLQYNHSGTLQKTIPVDVTLWSSRRSIHIVQNSVYMRTADQEDVPLATIENGLIEIISETIRTQPLTKGIHGQSGRKYYVQKLGQDEGRIEVFDDNGTLIQTITITVKKIASITFLEEDQVGNFYVQTERFLPPDNIVLEIHKFNQQGKLLSHIPIPENIYESWSVKLVDIRNNGDIHQLLPKKQRSYLNIFQQQKK